MIPKMDNAFAALRRGVQAVTIMSADSIGRLQNADSVGTTIIAE
jgi:acetylglutamate kinase